MLEAILSLVAASDGWVAYIALAIVGVFGLYFKGRADGKGVEKTRRQNENQETRDTADEIEAAIAGRDADANRERLRKWSR